MKADDFLDVRHEVRKNLVRAILGQMNRDGHFEENKTIFRLAALVDLDFAQKYADAIEK